MTYQHNILHVYIISVQMIEIMNIIQDRMNVLIQHLNLKDYEKDRTILKNNIIMIYMIHIYIKIYMSDIINTPQHDTYIYISVMSYTTSHLMISYQYNQFHFYMQLLIVIM